MQGTGDAEIHIAPARLLRGNIRLTHIARSDGGKALDKLTKVSNQSAESAVA